VVVNGIMALRKLSLINLISMYIRTLFGCATCLF
jgi:hypothetical protein